MTHWGSKKVPGTFNFQLYDSWKTLNRKVQSHLKLDSTNVNVQVYRGINHALIEVTQGLLKLFPHKKQVLYVKDAEPYFEAPIKELAKDGIKLIPIKRKEMAEGLKEKISKETLFFLYSYDVPLTGETLNTEPIDQLLMEERIFRVGVSHSFHAFNDLSMGLKPYCVRLLNLSPDLALGLLGEKAKLESLVAKGLIWPGDLEAEINKNLEQKSEDKEKIMSFEGDCPGGFTPYFKDEPRLYDRSVFYWEDMDGYAFIDEMAKELDITLKPPGLEDRLETASLSRWGGVRTMDWLKNYNLSTNAIRGLVIVRSDLIDDSFSKKVEAVRNKILKIQSGE